MRDTDQDWNDIGKNSPYYGVMSADKFLSPTEDVLREFFKTGEEYVSQELKYIRSLWPDFSPQSVLDFGCGVGRLAIPLARVAGTAVGIDVASNMRDLAAEHARKAGVDVEVLDEIPQGRQFEWVNSFIVFQHIPPARGYDLLAQLWEATVPGGLFAVQITAWKDANMQAEIAKEMGLFRYDGDHVDVFAPTAIGSGHLSMFDYDLARVFSIFGLDYGHTVSLKKTDHGGCHGFHIYVRKNAGVNCG